MSKKTIVITGSTRGIGNGLAREFLRMGHQVVINGRTKDGVDEVIGNLKMISQEVTGISGSVTKEETHFKLLECGLDNFGKIDIWINNAGIPQGHEKFINLETCIIEGVTSVNVFGLMLGTKVAANHMITQGYGKIFNMEGFGSDGRMMDKLSLYGTTKRAVNYFTKSISRELKHNGVQIGILSPGMVRTDFISTSMAEGSPEDIKRFKKVYDILAEDVDKVTSFLAPRILKSTKNYDRIEYLKGLRLTGKIIRMMFAR